MSTMKSYMSIVLVVFLAVGNLQAQQPKITSPRLHAYSKEVLGGAAPAVTIDESGNTREKVAKPSYQYYIYIETPKNQSLDIRYIWMDGKAFRVNRQKATLPIVLPGTSTLSSTGGDTLVYGSKNSFWKLDLNGIAKDRAPKTSVSTLLKSNVLVVEYVYKGRNYLLTTKEIKKLSPLVLQ
jgi:uncharacterized protein YcfL